MKFGFKSISVIIFYTIIAFAISCTKTTVSPIEKKLVKTEFYSYDYKFGVIDSTSKKFVKRIIYDITGKDSIKEDFRTIYEKTFIFYDSLGNLTDFITYDSTGHNIYKTIIKYDSTGKILEYNKESTMKDYQRPDNPDAMNIAYWREKFFYDEDRLVKKLESWKSFFSFFDKWDVTDNEITYVYDDNGNVVIEKVFDVKSKKLQWEYRYEYDSLGRITLFNSGGSSPNIRKYIYDDANNVIEETSGDRNKISIRWERKYDDI